MSKFPNGFELATQLPAVTSATAGSDMAPQQTNSKPLSHDDLSLMRRLGQGDESAMNTLIENHGEWVARLVGRLTAWSPEHEDVFQEVLLHVWQKANAFRGEGTLEGWLRRLTINRCHNFRRRQNSIKNMLVRLFKRQQEKDAVPSETGQSTRIQNAMAKLPARDREVLVLYYLEELAGDEVARSIGVNSETLHVRLHRARKKLKSILNKEVDDEP